MKIIYNEKWCGREDSNFHDVSTTATSRLRVYQFRHDRIFVIYELPHFNTRSAKRVQEEYAFQGNQ
jgi:hypothetical protein